MAAPGGESGPEPGSVRAYVGLGSNLGEREANLCGALEALDSRAGVAVVKASRFMETPPVGGPPGQDPYLNAAAELATTLSPRELLAACMEIEDSLGRTREVRWGPRTMDIDILLYAEEIVKEPDLVIPHPRMHERLFVLGPLCQIARGVKHPALGETIGELVCRWFETMSVGAGFAAFRGAACRGGRPSGEN